MLYHQKNLQRWLLLAPLALSTLAIYPAHAKDKDKARQTPPDFLLNRKFRQGVSLFDIAKVRGEWENARYTSVNGVNYRRSLVAQPKTGESATFTAVLDKHFDRFQAWVGTREGGTREDTNTFRIVGDGQELYKSPDLTGLDAAVRVDISVHDVSSLQLIVESKGAVRGVIAEPRLVAADTQTTPAKAVASAGTGELVEVARPNDEPVAVQVGGKTLDFGDTPPLVRGNRVLVSMRPLFEQLGAQLSFDPDTQEITATRNGHRVDLTVGSTAARVDGQLVYLDVPVQTLKTAQITSTLTPTNTNPPTTTTDAGAAGAGSAGGSSATSALPDLKVPPASALNNVTPSATIIPKDTDTTVTPGTGKKSSEEEGPILVPLRFIAEAFDLPVGFGEF